jgi:hypothetical protein
MAVLSMGMRLQQVMIVPAVARMMLVRLRGLRARRPRGCRAPEDGSDQQRNRPEEKQADPADRLCSHSAIIR